MSKDIHVPDIGEYSDVEVIDVVANVGDVVAEEDIIITLETEKATMDIPAPIAGKVVNVHVKPGDRVSQGTLIFSMEAAGDASKQVEQESQGSQQAKGVKQEKGSAPAASQLQSSTAIQVAGVVPDASIVPLASQPVADGTPNVDNVYAGPGVRRFAYSLGVNLSRVGGRGLKGRVLKTDVEAYVKQTLASGVAPAANECSDFSVMSMKDVDFSKFGEVEEKPLPRIKKISGATLHRNWVHIPHVTQFDEADITEMEEFRQQQKVLAEKRGVKLTPLVFIIKAVIAGLKEFEHFNASLNVAGDTLTLKKYFHVGVAVDTPNGLVVPVLRDADQKGLLELAEELAELSKLARDGKLTAAQMQGGCFTISSLGGIGGTAFTPIINAPEVAILGVSKSSIKPIYNKGQNDFAPRLMLPLSLSYDHRVIDGAEAVRFTRFLVQQLSDIRHLLL